MRGAGFVLAALLASGCLHRPVADPDIIVVNIVNGPNNLNPLLATDDSSQKLHQLIYDSLMELDDRLRVVPRLAERLDHPTPTTFVATLRQGVRFHDGHELTAADVVYTFATLIDPEFASPRKGGYVELAAVAALDQYRVLFTLKQPFESFPINLLMPIVPAGGQATLRTQPIGTGPYKFVRYAVDDRVELVANQDYFGGAPKNAGLILKIVPDDVMRGLELEKGTTDIVVNDLAPDIVHQMRDEGRLRITQAPGVDYQYVGLNLRDPLLSDVRVRQALAYAIDRDAIVTHLRRGFAEPALGLLPRLSWAFADDLFPYPHDPQLARGLLDAAGYPDPDGAGPGTRFSLSLKVSNIEFNRLQSSVMQRDLLAVGIQLDVRTYEFATLYADVLSGNFQLYTLQWTAGSLADPDILRRVFHSKQTPPAGFNRGAYSNRQVDALLDAAAASLDAAERLSLFQQAQRLLAVDVPYISLWNKTNFAVAQPSLSGIDLSPMGDLLFLKDVARTRPIAGN
jgi:peptide/nickel transport system substrate-binding protein